MDNPNITTMRVILFAQRRAMKLHSKNEWKSLDKTFYLGNIFLASEFAWSTYYALVAKLSYVFGMNPRQHSTKRCWWCIHYLFADGYRPKHNKNQQKPVSEKLLGSLLRAHAWLGLKAAYRQKYQEKPLVTKKQLKGKSSAVLVKAGNNCPARYWISDLKTLCKTKLKNWLNYKFFCTHFAVINFTSIIITIKQR